MAPLHASVAADGGRLPMGHTRLLQLSWMLLFMAAPRLPLPHRAAPAPIPVRRCRIGCCSMAGLDHQGAGVCRLGSLPRACHGLCRRTRPEPGHACRVDARVSGAFALAGLVGPVTGNMNLYLLSTAGYSVGFLLVATEVILHVRAGRASDLPLLTPVS